MCFEVLGFTINPADFLGVFWIILKTGTNLNVSIVIGIDILRNSVGNFMGAHMIYPLADSSEEDQVVVGAVAGLEVTV